MSAGSASREPRIRVTRSFGKLHSRPRPRRRRDVSPVTADVAADIDPHHRDGGPDRPGPSTAAQSSASRPCKGCSSGPSRSRRCSVRPLPVPPLLALTSSHASLTSHFEISNGLVCDFNWSTELLPDTARLMRSTQSRTTRPLRSTPVTGASSLHEPVRQRVPHRYSAPSRHNRSGCSLSPAPTRTGCIGTRLLLFHMTAADQVHVVSMPDTAWPVGGLPPGLSRDGSKLPGFDVVGIFSTRQQRFTCVRLPDPHLTPLGTFSSSLTTTVFG